MATGAGELGYGVYGHESRGKERGFEAALTAVTGSRSRRAGELKTVQIEAVVAGARRGRRGHGRR
jgi:hypothetical protein